MITQEIRTIQTPKVRKEFINYIHNFRGIAILFVVACHLLLEWGDHSRLHRFLDLLFGNGTVLFVFIAGYLFQYLSKKFEYGDYLRKKLLNVILPYFIVSIPIIVYRILKADYPGYIFTNEPDFLTWSVARKVVYMMLHGAHMQPLWFVPMITLFYLAAPVFIYIDRHPKLYYLLFVFAGISFLVQREPFSNIPKMFVHFISVYVFGMFMSRYKNEYLAFAKKFWLPITLATAGLLVLNFVFYDPYNNPFNYLQKMFLCAFFIYWLWKLDKYIPKFLSVLADLSFGIFFLHYYVLLILKGLYQKYTGHGIPGNFIYWAIDFALVVIGTVIVIKTIKAIFPKRSRNLIGC
jgi:peptidoglycan/LPS O-acetylase OafA/YrhL